MNMMIANVAGEPTHDFVQLQVAGGLHRRSTTCPRLRWQDSHVLEAVLSEEQETADHRSDGHWQQDNKERDIETTEDPQHRNQRAVTEQYQQRIPVPGWIPQKWQQRDAEKKDREVPCQYGQRMTLDPVGDARREGSIVPHISGHHRKGASAGRINLAYMTMVIVVAVLPRSRRRERERREQAKQPPGGSRMRQYRVVQIVVVRNESAQHQQS